MDGSNEKEIFRSDVDGSNLFSDSMLLIFKNVDHIIIKNESSKSYSMSMLYLLSLIEGTKVNKVKVANRSNFGLNWIDNLWENKSEELREEYFKKNYHIKFNKINNSDSEFLINKF